MEVINASPTVVLCRVMAYLKTAQSFYLKEMVSFRARREASALAH